MQNTSVEALAEGVKGTATKAATTACSLGREDYQYFCEFLKARAGISLGDDKGYLVDSRLLPIARENSLKDVTELVQALRSGRPGLANQVVNAMVTHETFFFRDGKPFEVFKEDLLPEFKERRASVKRLKIWCAACSSGQEPYTLAMIMQEKARDFPTWTMDILGTDISPAVIEKAKRAHFTQFEVQRGLPVQLLIKYFKQTDCDWQLSQEIRNAVKFQVRNLMDDLRGMGPFDMIFCRNVLIYFDPPTKERILKNMAQVLAPDGCLVLGASETVLGLSDFYKNMEGKRGIYRPAAFK